MENSKPAKTYFISDNDGGPSVNSFQLIPTTLLSEVHNTTLELHDVIRHLPLSLPLSRVPHERMEA